MNIGSVSNNSDSDSSSSDSFSSDSSENESVDVNNGSEPVDCNSYSGKCTGTVNGKPFIFVSFIVYI